jgi:hypothetical protein
MPPFGCYLSESTLDSSASLRAIALALRPVTKSLERSHMCVNHFRETYVLVSETFEQAIP